MAEMRATMCQAAEELGQWSHVTCRAPERRPAAGTGSAREEAGGVHRVIDARTKDKTMAAVPGGATGLLVRDYKGKNADIPVYRVDTALMAELRAIMRQAAEELGQWVAKSETQEFQCARDHRAPERRAAAGARGLGEDAGAQCRDADATVNRAVHRARRRDDCSDGAEMRDIERKAAEELGQWEKRRALSAETQMMP